MLLIGSILTRIARLERHSRVAGKMSWSVHRQRPRVAGGNIRPRAKRFLTLDITIPNSGETRSFGLYLMPHPSFWHGTRIYGATVIDQTSTAYSARFITDGRHCLIVFVGDTRGTSLEFEMKPWSCRIAVAGTLPNAVASSDDNAATSTCVQQYYSTARSIIDAEHPTTRSDINRIRRRVAKLLHPDLGPAMEVACRARAMAMMNAELDELGSRFAA
ncbi:hypothetical protein [Microvirga sp. KLBC 81]|uniref:hypothetical protein n=1 Tax=Microvirga sp. KLBC 81 TaxID=1862707 RepID=UPI0010582E80|nr:hypothetical protein [Microvirga sp. KLBC 81]